MRGSFEKQKQEANKLNESAIEYSILKRELDSNRTLYEGLLEKLKEAGVTAGLRPTISASLMRPAYPRLRASRMFRATLPLLSFSGSFLV